ncbi:MAG: DMT family transporter [Cypionkella sp.]|nr:DMT family transporter [Cypionkella sp.]
MNTAPRPDRTLLGIVLMLAFCVLAPMLDASSKLATATIPVGQIVAARFVVQGALMIPVALAMGLTWGVSRRVGALIMLRALLLIVSTYSFVAAVAVMPIADALAIAFLSPLILLILGHFIFGNPVGPRRIGAAIVGFAGALLVIQPSLQTYGAATFYALACAFAFAFYMAVTQSIAGHIHPVTQQLHTSLAGAAVIVPILYAMDGVGGTGISATLDPVMPQGYAWLWLFGVGFWAALAHMCMTISLRFAPASTLAPLHYFEMVVAVALGYVIFGDFPNLMTWGGIVLIVGAGLYIIQRERVLAAAQSRAAPQANAGAAE